MELLCLMVFFLTTWVGVDAYNDNRQKLIPGMVLGLYIPSVIILMLIYYYVLKKKYKTERRPTTDTPRPKPQPQQSREDIAVIGQQETYHADGVTVTKQTVAVADARGNVRLKETTTAEDIHGNKVVMQEQCGMNVANQLRY